MPRLAFSFLVVVACPLLAQDKPPVPPPVPQPPVLTAGNVTVMGNTIFCDVHRTALRTVNEQRIVIKQGQKVVETVARQVPYTIAERIVLDPKTLRAFRTGEKGNDPTKALVPVEAAAITALLKESRQVKIAHGEAPKPEQVKDLNPGTVILVFPKVPETPKAPEKK